MNIELKILPWVTPNYIIADMPPRPRQEGLVEAPKWHIKDLDANILSQQCDIFRAEIFKKAGKIDPKKGCSES